MNDDTVGATHTPITLAESFARYGHLPNGAEKFLEDHPHLIANTCESNRDPSPTHYPDGSPARARARKAVPHDDRKAVPLARGLLDYFPLALIAVSQLSLIGATKHNNGTLAWNRAASDDHGDALLRHMLDRGTYDDDGVLHDVKVAWRALAQAQLALEKAAAHG